MQFNSDFYAYEVFFFTIFSITKKKGNKKSKSFILEYPAFLYEQSPC